MKMISRCARVLAKEVPRVGETPLDGLLPERLASTAKFIVEPLGFNGNSIELTIYRTWVRKKPSGLRCSRVVEADGRAPVERQAVAKIAREVPPNTDARLAEEPVEDRRQRVELIREPRDPLLQLARRHVAWSKDRVDLAVVAVPIRRQQASGTDHLVEERRAEHRHDDAYCCAVDADPSIESQSALEDPRVVPIEPEHGARLNGDAMPV